MNKLLSLIEALFSFLGALIGWLFGGVDSLIYALIAFVIFDYITGVLLAFEMKTISSEIGFKGISRKILIFLVVSIGNVIDQYVIKSGNTLKAMLIMFYLSNEGISIIENAGKLGVPLPQKLKDAIRQLQDKK